MLNNPLLSTAYLAPISYYAILLKQNNSMIEYHEHFIKKSIRNRCDIMNTNGRLSLSIPINSKKKSQTLKYHMQKIGKRIIGSQLSHHIIPPHFSNIIKIN